MYNFLVIQTKLTTQTLHLIVKFFFIFFKFWASVEKQAFSCINQNVEDFFKLKKLFYNK